MKSFMLALTIFLFFITFMSLAGGSTAVIFTEPNSQSIALLSFIGFVLSLLFGWFSLGKFLEIEDDFLFLWIKTKSKRLIQRKDLAKEAMKKELEED